MIDFLRRHQLKFFTAAAVFIGLLVGHKQIGGIFGPGPTKPAPAAKQHRKGMDASNGNTHSPSNRPGPPTGATVTCDLVAAPNGSNSAAGTAAAPFKSGQKLVNSLSPGQTGCFRGTTTGSINVSTPNLTLTSYPGERATVQGRLWITVNAPGTTVTELNLDGRPGVTSPTISADNVTFRGNDVTNHHTAICFSLGSDTYRPQGTVIDHNDIHDCGVLPAANQDHGIYIVNADHTTITNNWIHHNADRAIQLYPNADHTTITGNVIDSNGEGVIFSGDPIAGTYQTSDYNTVEHNVLTNAQVRQNVGSYYPDGAAVGVGNVVANNCAKGTANPSYAGSDGSGIMSPAVGFAASSNLVASPGYANGAIGNYRILTANRCSALLAAAGVDPSAGLLDKPPPLPPLAQ